MNRKHSKNQNLIGSRHVSFFLCIGLREQSENSSCLTKGFWRPKKIWRSCCFSNLAVAEVVLKISHQICSWQTLTKSCSCWQQYLAARQNWLKLSSKFHDWWEAISFFVPCKKHRWLDVKKRSHLMQSNVVGEVLSSVRLAKQWNEGFRVRKRENLRRLRSKIVEAHSC